MFLNPYDVYATTSFCYMGAFDKAWNDGARERSPNLSIVIDGALSENWSCAAFTAALRQESKQLVTILGYPHVRKAQDFISGRSPYKPSGLSRPIRSGSRRGQI